MRRGRREDMRGEEEGGYEGGRREDMRGGRGREDMRGGVGLHKA